jgi:transcriptional regulator with XRE-family HTH domain
MLDRLARPGFIDRHVGARIKAQREALGMTPAEFGARLGCDAGMVLDYESGRLRAGAMTLLTLTQVCGVGVGYFLSGLGGGSEADPPPSRH